MFFFRNLFTVFSCLIFSGSIPAVAYGAEAYAAEAYGAEAYGDEAAENLSVQCSLPVKPTLTDEQTQSEPGTIKIISKNTNLEKNEIALFTGGVTLINKKQRIIADNLAFDRVSNSVDAKGNIHFQDDNIDIYASDLQANESSKTTTLSETSYQLSGNPGHGSADRISINKDGSMTLLGSSYTPCIGKLPDWQFKASEINISEQENFGEAYNVRFKLFNVPVLYLPYFTFPVTDQRKSGLLPPSLSSSKNSGIELVVPFYWNITENMDATISPRYLSKRGTQWLNEFRYLSGQQSGMINLEYLNSDNELKANNDARYLGRIQHAGTFSEHFRAYVDYTAISDDNYLVDLGSRHYNASDAYLYQIGELAYFSDNWQAKIKMQDFEVLGDHVDSYKTVPQIEFKGQRALPFWQGQFDLYSELSRFVNPNSSLPQANRYHVEAALTFPIKSPAWFLNSEFKLLQTNYQQQKLSANSQLAKDVSRTLPKVRFHGGINFERPSAYFGRGFVQTFEPQLQYLYIPQKEQSQIGLFDTTRLQDDYNGLFRDRRFSGLDRIARANQYSWGVTSRILNPSHQEIFRLSLGGIVYLDGSQLTTETGTDVSADKSVLAADLFYHVNTHWQLKADIQYNTETKQTNKSQISLDYQFDKNRLIQLNHRYSRRVSGSSLEQLSVLVNARINSDWQYFARFTTDLRQKRSLENFAGLQYESCCWGVRFGFHRRIRSNLDQQSFIDENRDEFDSGFMLDFVKAFGGQQPRVGAAKIFNSSIFGYKRPYFLNN
jgi:LPS-assembly protein